MSRLLHAWWTFVNRVVEVVLILVGLHTVIGQWWHNPELTRDMVLGLGIVRGCVFAVSFVALVCLTFAALGDALSGHKVGASGG